MKIRRDDKRPQRGFRYPLQCKHSAITSRKAIRSEILTEGHEFQGQGWKSAVTHSGEMPPAGQAEAAGSLEDPDPQAGTHREGWEA